MFLLTILLVFISCLVVPCLEYRGVTSAYPDTDEDEQNEQNKQDTTSSILFTRTFNAASRQTFEVTDALIERLSSTDSVRNLKYGNFYTMNTTETFRVTDDIDCSVEKVEFDESEAIKHISFRIYSRTLTLTQLRQWVNDVHSEFEEGKKNALGDKRYFFNQQLRSINSRGEAKFLQFNMTPFETTKSLSNLYGEHVDTVKQRIRLFQDKNWYSRHGVPHTLGILLHGEPGCGKTSIIKAIAKETKRHVFNIRLNDNMTKDQLASLFFDNTVHLEETPLNINNRNNTINIPLNQRLYVLEDIDCAKETVFSRSSGDETKAADTWEGDYGERLGPRELAMLREAMEERSQGRIDLSFLLNILDGVLETPERLIIMTTNYPDRIDRALLRPGRLDMQLHFNKCDHKMIKTMVENFFGGDDTMIDTDRFTPEMDGVVTPAIVQETLLNYIGDPQQAIEVILQKINVK